MNELRHGYTLADLHAIARQAVHTDWSHSASDYADRLDTAWCGVVEHLYAAESAPSRRDLVWAGRGALHAETQKELSSRGVSYHYGYAEMVNFARYWAWFARNTPSHEDRIVERRALDEIWPHLKAVDREALLALAAHDDYTLAANALGKKYHTFAAAVRRARLNFLKLWHQGEEPSRPWGHDRRAGKPGERAATIRTATRKLHRRHQMASSAAAKRAEAVA